MNTIQSFHPLYQQEGAGTGPAIVSEIKPDLPETTETVQTGIPAKSNKAKAPDVNIYSCIKDMPYQAIADIITSHLRGSNKEPFKDRQALALGFTKWTKCFWFDNKSNLAFEGTTWASKVHPTIAKWTLDTLIQQQFAWAIDVVNKQGFAAEFIHIKVPTTTGYALCRIYQYNPAGGFVTAEWREYTNIKVAEATISPASNAKVKSEIVAQQFTLADNAETAEAIDVKEVVKTGKIEPLGS